MTPPVPFLSGGVTCLRSGLTAGPGPKSKKNMNQSMNRILPILLFLLLTSCSIKEDRTDCPCYLIIDFGSLPNHWDADGRNLWMDILDRKSEVVVLETVTLTEPLKNRGMRVKVPKGKALVAAAGGRHRFRPTPDGKMLVLPEGYQSDSLYLHGRLIDCSGETARDTVRLHKQWCTLSLVVSGMDSFRKYDFELSGAWAAFSAEDLSPLRSPFKSVLTRTNHDRFLCRIPRQGDNELELRLFEENQDGTRGRLIHAYPLGELIYRAGYNWFATDLDDVTVMLDFARADITVGIQPWNEGGNMGNIVI